MLVDGCWSGLCSTAILVIWRAATWFCSSVIKLERKPNTLASEFLRAGVWGFIVFGMTGFICSVLPDFSVWSRPDYMRDMCDCLSLIPTYIPNRCEGNCFQFVITAQTELMDSQYPYRKLINECRPNAGTHSFEFYTCLYNVACVSQWKYLPP